MPGEDWKTEFSDEAKAVMEADPAAAEAIRVAVASMRQALHDLEEGKFESIEEAMASIGAEQVEQEDVPQTGAIITLRDTMNEQPAFIYFECQDCGFDSIQCSDFKGSDACPLCAGDSGHDVAMTSRVCRESDTAEGFDARKGTRAEQLSRKPSS